MKTFFKTIMLFLLAALLTAALFPVGAGAIEMEDIPDAPQVLITGLSLVLDGEIGLVFHFSVPTVYRNGYLTLNCPGTSPQKTSLADCQKDKAGKYTAVCLLSANQLAEKVTLTVFSSTGKKLASKSGSAADYAQTLLKSGIASEEEKKVARTLMNYGHYAQIVCSKECGWTIGTDYAEIAAIGALSADPTVFAPYAAVWKNSDSLPIALSLSLDYRTGIRIFLPSTAEKSVTVDGAEAEVRSCSFGGYSRVVEIEGVNALNLEKTFTVSIGEKTVTLSAFSYCELAASQNPDADVLNAVRALYEFHEAAAAFRASVN